MAPGQTASQAPTPEAPGASARAPRAGPPNSKRRPSTAPRKRSTQSPRESTQQRSFPAGPPTEDQTGPRRILKGGLLSLS